MSAKKMCAKFDDIQLFGSMVFTSSVADERTDGWTGGHRRYYMYT